MIPWCKIMTVIAPSTLILLLSFIFTKWVTVQQVAFHTVVGEANEVENKSPCTNRKCVACWVANTQDERHGGLVHTLGHVPRTVPELKGLPAWFIRVGGTWSTSWSKIHSRSKYCGHFSKLSDFLLSCPVDMDGWRKMQAKVLNFQSIRIRYAFFVQQFRITAFPSLPTSLVVHWQLFISCQEYSRSAEQYLKGTAMGHINDHCQHIPKYIP